MNNTIAKYYNSSRNGTADLLKGVAVLLMIQVHVTELFLKPDIYNSLYGKVSLFLGGPPAAPLFMAVMGYFLASSGKSFSQMIKRGIMLLAAGILLNLGLNANLLFKIYSGKLIVNPYEYIFGVDILFLAGLSIFAVAVIKKISNKNVFAIAVIMLLVVVFHPFLPSTQHPVLKYFNAYFYGDYTWSYFPFLPWFAYVLAGYIFYLLSEKFNGLQPKKIRFVVIAITIGLALTFSYALDISASLEIYYHHQLLFFIWTLLFLSVLIVFAGWIEKRVGTTFVISSVKFLGQNVTLAYVFQWLVIGNLATEVYKTFSLTEGIFSFFGVTLLTYLLILVYRWTENNYFGSRANLFSGK